MVEGLLCRSIGFDEAGFLLLVVNLELVGFSALELETGFLLDEDGFLLDGFLLDDALLDAGLLLTALEAFSLDSTDGVLDDSSKLVSSSEDELISSPDVL